MARSRVKQREKSVPIHPTPIHPLILGIGRQGDGMLRGAAPVRDEIDVRIRETVLEGGSRIKSPLVLDDLDVPPDAWSRNGHDFPRLRDVQGLSPQSA